MRYEDDPRFDSYYLEDSYVLGLDESEPSRLVFSLLLVLTPKHPFYSAPEPNEQYCYRNGALTFEGVSAINWAERTFRPVRDSAGEIDYGNIDVFELEANERYDLKGEWGRVTITAETARIDVY
jgi:hypothetical protein